MPGVSVVMPVYNEERTITEAVKRLLAVEFPGGATEVLIVDDGSTDGTAERLAAESWPERVRLFRHPMNAGKGRAIQTALNGARGRWTAILDADLEYDPTDTASRALASEPA
jgi:glycosyltransferase involved in cell wall biosynthesis